MPSPVEAGRCACADAELASTATPVAATTAHARARREIPFNSPSPLSDLEPECEVYDNPMRRLVELWHGSQSAFAPRPRKTSRPLSSPRATIRRDQCKVVTVDQVRPPSLERRIL